MVFGLVQSFHIDLEVCSPFMHGPFINSPFFYGDPFMRSPVGSPFVRGPLMPGLEIATTAMPISIPNATEKDILWKVP